MPFRYFVYRYVCGLLLDFMVTNWEFRLFRRVCILCKWVYCWS